MSHTLLILDDDSDILFFCTYVFESMGFKVISSNHCNGIVSQVESAEPDIILIDNWIPDIGGVKATQLLKSTAHLKNIPVILFSANSNLPKLAEEAGADDHLKKPFDLEDLENLALRHVGSV